MNTLADIVAGAYALIFLAAALGKLDSWAAWSRLSREIARSDLLGSAVRSVVPAVEGLVGVLCFVAPTAGLAAAAVLLAFFALAILLLSRRLAGEDCNCFGAIAPATISPRLAARNLALAIIAAGGWYAASQQNLQARSLGQMLVTLLLGTIALMFIQFRRLAVSAPARATAKEIE